jgi:hypothetical protein
VLSDVLGVLKSRLWRHGKKESGMQQYQKRWDEYHKWDKEFCTDAAPTYWECWKAAWAVVRNDVSRLEADFYDALVKRNNAEKREYEVLGRANALEVANKLAARMEADAQERADFLLAVLKDIGDFAHDRSTGPAIEDALWEVRRMAYEAMTPNASLSGRGGPATTE